MLPAPPVAEEIYAGTPSQQVAYKSAIQKIPDQKKSADPWENVRPTTSSKAKQGQ